MLTATTAGRGFLAEWLPASASAASTYMHTHGQVDVDAQTPYSPKFFTPEEFETVDTLTEMIIPQDDKPGARQARVAQYIDFIVFSSAEFEPHMQRQWSDGLKTLERLTREKFGRSFRDISPDQRVALLTDMSGPEHQPGTSHPGFEFYSLLKGMTVEGFYTSKLGLLGALDYQGLTYLAEFPGCTHPEHH